MIKMYYNFVAYNNLENTLFVIREKNLKNFLYLLDEYKRVGLNKFFCVIYNTKSNKIILENITVRMKWYDNKYYAVGDRMIYENGIGGYISLRDVNIEYNKCRCYMY